MRETQILHRFLEKSVPEMHSKRRKALVDCVEPILKGSILSVTEVGRNLKGAPKTKHNIKRVDRLLSNKHLHAESQNLYKAITQYLCGSNPNPIILVDWSDLVQCDRVLVIRAAISLKGRAVTLYEKAYPLEKYNKPVTHRHFLKTLKAQLPEGCTPTIVTDAGFRGPWFRDVEKHGWHWIGRIRNCICFSSSDKDNWAPTKSLHKRANAIPKYVGHCRLSKKKPYECHLYLYKKKKVGRKSHRTAHAFRRHAKESVFRKQQKEPWIIATNLPPTRFDAADIIRIYGKRMEIEECFRDLKSHRSGFGYNFCLSKKIDRINVLLLMAALATVCLWWVGIAVEKKAWQYHFQANTHKARRVFSTLFIAREVLKHSGYIVPYRELLTSFQELPSLIERMNEC